MKRKLIVIDGTDGSGKATQAELLRKKLIEHGYPARLLSFPRYADAASIFERRYLEGRYGKEADSVNPYAASLFFAADRYDCFAGENEDGVIILDRYTTSNMIHQASKIKDKAERDKFINWLEDLEYNKLGIPEPDLVFFLNTPPEISETLIDRRVEQEERKKDIHERDKAYLEESYRTAKDLAREKEWSIIDCYEDGILRNREEINTELLNRVLELLREEPG